MDVKSLASMEYTYTSMMKSAILLLVPMFTIGSKVIMDDYLYVTCNVSEYLDDFFHVILVVLERKSDKDSTFQMLAVYAPKSAIGKETKSFIPIERDWDISFKVYREFNGESRILIVLRINDPSCEDAGLYVCGYRLEDEDEITYLEPITIETPVSVIQNDIAINSPYYSEDSSSEVAEDENVTLTCTFKGKPALRGNWVLPDVSGQRKKNFKITEYPILTVRDEYGCVLSYYKTVLSFSVTSETAGWTYRCDIYNLTDLLSTTYFIVELKTEQYRLDASFNSGREVQEKRASIWCSITALIIAQCV
ncbi:uncharacterized protein LOC106076630 isoform X1 [Biomphalaria glabrata]|uniref:Uncharacterized protein LOC106076630 isoform X1 n=2 Tax=Biomphalaria glabrata TaxID=6526 RepID=A0A9W2ZC72_BIOGL|nr:uncharacterized protein LOC106076630 isoform X1 [Biomphalaria glabrata]